MTTRLVQNQAPAVKVGKLKIPDLEAARGSAAKPEALKDVKVDPEKKPIELKPYIVSSPSLEPRGSKRKRETITTSVELDNDYYVIRKIDPETGKFQSTGIRLPVDDQRVEAMLENGSALEPEDFQKLDKTSKSTAGFVELARVYTDEAGVSHSKVKYFTPADPNASEIIDLMNAKDAMKTPELEENFIVSVQTEIVNGEEVTVETLTPVESDSPTKRKFKTAYEKDHFVEITRVLKDSQGKSYEEVKKFRKGDPEIDKFVQGLTVVSSTTVSERYTKTRVEETRSEFDPAAPGVPAVQLQSSRTKIQTTIDREIEDELMDSKDSIPDSSSLQRSSTPVQLTDEKLAEAGGIKPTDKRVTFVIQGRKVEEIRGTENEMSQISVLTVKVNQDLRMETSHKVFVPDDAEVAKLRLEGSLPNDLKPNQGYASSEVFVEVNKLSPTDDQSNYFTETLLFKPRENDFLSITLEHNVGPLYETMIKTAVECLCEFGELPGSGLEDILLSEEGVVKGSDIDIVVEQISVEDSDDETEFIIIKFQTSHGEKVWRYPQGDPELLDMVNAGIIPADAIPPEMMEPRESLGDEIVEIVLGEGENAEKLYFRLDDPKLVEQVKGTDYEEEVMAMLEEAGISHGESSDVFDAPGLSHIHITAKKHKSVSDASEGRESCSSSDSLLSEQEIEGMKVVLHTVNIEDKMDPFGKKYSLVTKTYLSEIGDKVEFEKRYESGSEKLNKLRKSLPIVKTERGITYIDSIDIKPQFELPISRQKSTDSELKPAPIERPISPGSMTLKLLQSVTDDGENKIDTWSFKAEEELNDNGERLIRVFDNHEGLNIETVHRADSPTILNLISSGLIPESFCTTPVQDRSTEEVVQRKFQMKKREATEHLPTSRSSEVLMENPAVYIIRVEDVVEDYENRMVKVTERFVDEKGEETVSQQTHRPDSPTLVALVDQGTIPAPFLLEEPEHEIISEGSENGENFVERVVKRVYERANSEFVPFLPESADESVSPDEKIQFEKFDPHEADMNVQDVKLANELIAETNEKVVHVSRQGVNSSGDFIVLATRHRPKSPTVERYRKEGRLTFDLSDKDLQAKTGSTHCFQPYLSVKEKPNSKLYQLFTDKDWLSGALSSQQSSHLLFVPDKTLSKIYDAVNVPFSHKNYLPLNSWDTLGEKEDANFKVNTVAVEHIRQENEKVVVVAKKLLDQKGVTIFTEIREFKPNSRLVKKLVEDGKLSKTVFERQLSASPIALKLINQNLKHQKSSEKSEVVYETVKSKDPSRKIVVTSAKRPSVASPQTGDVILKAKLDEDFSSRGDKILTVLQVRKVPNDREVMEIRKYPPKCIFIDEIIKYNELPKSLQTPLPSEKSSYLIMIPKSLWDNSLGDATSIESHERLTTGDRKEKENEFELTPGQVPSSLQQRITEINIKSKKKPVTEREKPVVIKDEPAVAIDDDFAQQVSILTTKRDAASKAPDDIMSTEPITVSDEDQLEPSKFISSLVRKCQKIVVEPLEESPNSAPQSESTLPPEDQPVVLDVSALVLNRAAQPNEKIEKPGTVKKPEFYKDPLIKEVFPDLSSEFEELPPEVQESILTRIDAISKKRKDSTGDVVEEDIPPLSAEVESMATTGDFEMPCSLFSVVAEKGEADDDVVMRREMKTHDATESRKYPSKTPFISSLVKEGKLFDVGEAEPSLNREQELDVPAVDWLASIGEVKTVSLVPSKAIDNNSSMSSIGSRGYPYSSRVRMMSLSGSPSDSVLADLESGYESVTPVQTTTPPLDKDKLDASRDGPPAMPHTDFRTIPTIDEESSDVSSRDEKPKAKEQTLNEKPKVTAPVALIDPQVSEPLEEECKEFFDENVDMQIRDKQQRDIKSLDKQTPTLTDPDTANIAPMEVDSYDDNLRSSVPGVLPELEDSDREKPEMFEKETVNKDQKLPITSDLQPESIGDDTRRPDDPKKYLTEQNLALEVIGADDAVEKIEDLPLDNTTQVPGKSKPGDKPQSDVKKSHVKYPTKETDQEDDSITESTETTEEPNVIDSIEKFQPIITSVGKDPDASKLETFQPIIKGDQSQLEPLDEDVQTVDSKPDQVSTVSPCEIEPKEGPLAPQLVENVVRPQPLKSGVITKETAQPSLMAEGLGFAAITTIPQDEKSEASVTTPNEQFMEVPIKGKTRCG